MSSSTTFKSPEEMVESPYYDTDYSIDINKKMTVPNKIKAVEGSYNELLDDPAILAFHDSEDKAKMMQVPECIRVAGTHLIVCLFCFRYFFIVFLNRRRKSYHNFTGTTIRN